MDAFFESTYVPAGAFDARRLEGQALERARAYARWTLSAESFEESVVAAVAERWLRRSPLIPASAALEKPLAVLLGPRLQAGLKVAHQIQLSLARLGGPRPVACDLAEGGDFSAQEARLLAEFAAEDLCALWRALSTLYPGPPEPSSPLFVSFYGRQKPGWDLAQVLEGGGEAEALPAPERVAARPQPGALRALLRRGFGHADFRPGQLEALSALLEGRDCAALLPTAAGKSLIPQLAALLRPGTAVVVEPLLAVVADQRRALRRAGIAACGAAEDLEDLAAGRLLLCYVSPERFESAPFRAALRAAAERGVPFVAVDEAHCVTQWGHDFRPALLAVGRRARRWAAGPDGEPALAALTGTASRRQLEAAWRALGLRAPVITARPLARPELSFEVERCGPGDHGARLRSFIRAGRRFGPGLAFCPRVDGALGAAGVCEDLVWGEGVAAGCFTGRPPRGVDGSSWQRRKKEAARAFLSGDLDWLCCTRAFGLGVDVPQARWTVHLGLPDSLESFLQEAGRAGRDGKPAVCRVIFHLADEKKARRWLSPDCAWEEAWTRSRAVEDDLAAALALHRRSYPGEASECADADLAARALGPLRAGRPAMLTMPGQSDGPLLRAAARFEEAGLAEIRARRADGVELLALRDCGPQEVALAGKRSVEFVYAEVEPARRASLGRLLEACLARDPGAAIASAF